MKLTRKIVEAYQKIGQEDPHHPYSSDFTQALFRDWLEMRRLLTQLQWEGCLCMVRESTGCVLCEVSTAYAEDGHSDECPVKEYVDTESL